MLCGTWVAANIGLLGKASVYTPEIHVSRRGRLVSLVASTQYNDSSCVDLNILQALVLHHGRC